MNYPSIAIIGNKEYQINTDYKVALNCCDVIEDDISDIERAYAIIGLLFDDEIPQEYLNEALEKAKKFLECGKENTTSSIKDMDFKQDEGYIMSSFIADYKIDLSEINNMHWWKYCDLISGLSENSILNRIRDIRNYDINSIKDTKEKAKMIKAKENVALRINLTKEEQEAIDEFESLF